MARRRHGPKAKRPRLSDDMSTPTTSDDEGSVTTRSRKEPSRSSANAESSQIEDPKRWKRRQDFLLEQAVRNGDMSAPGFWTKLSRTVGRTVSECTSRSAELAAARKAKTARPSLHQPEVVGAIPRVHRPQQLRRARRVLVQGAATERLLSFGQGGDDWSNLVGDLDDGGEEPGEGGLVFSPMSEDSELDDLLVAATNTSADDLAAKLAREQQQLGKRKTQASNSNLSPGVRVLPRRLSFGGVAELFREPKRDSLAASEESWE
mmetsp:Transcript_9243/g.22240  ORF Transcript_9243/g.22240 Transcript_9243/m.22240 type:complete len:263 (-) Transcript_9243:79-867(-)